MNQRLSNMTRLAYGKIRRFYYHTFRRDYIKRKKKVRHGECARCGTCCRLLFKCVFLDESQNPAICRIHNTRPMNCRIFPVDREDLLDRDLVDRTKRCGYYFESES